MPKNTLLLLLIQSLLISQASSQTEGRDSLTITTVEAQSNTDSAIGQKPILPTAGDAILETGHKIAIIDKDIIKGSCWDFVNEVYRRAGFKETKKTVFRSKKSGPYAPVDMVKPGDWIYHINHNYKNNEHSAIFVRWKDYEKKIGITLSYAGMNKSVPGKYGEYNLKSIYSIFRPE